MREVLLALIFLLPFFQQAVFPPDSLYGHVAEWQVELALEPSCAERGQLVAESQHVLFDGGRCFQGMAMRSAAVLAQARGTMLLIAPPPLADRQGTGGKEPCSGFDTAFADRLYQTKAMVVSVFHLTDQIKVTSGSGHNAGSLLPARRPALPPAGRPSPAASSDSHTSTPLGGNDVPFQFHPPLSA